MRQGVGQKRETALEPEADRPVVGGGQLRRDGGEGLTEGVVDPPALDAGHRVAGEYGGAVMEHKAVAKGEGPGQAVGLGGIAGQHLRLSDAGLVHGEQGVVDHQHVVARHEGADGGIEEREVGIGNEPQRGLGLRTHDRRTCQNGSPGHSSPE